jgi:hypothetical protein
VESVSILRALTRRPLLLGLGVALALAIGLLAAYRVSPSPPFLSSKTVSSGFANQRVLVDTPESLIANAQAKGATAIVVRATILADLVTSEAAQARIARALGVPPREVGAIASTIAVPQTESPLAKQVLEVTRPVAPYVVSVGLEAGQPILAIQAVAPDSQAAACLIAATTEVLTEAGRRGAPARGPVRVEQLGAAEVGAKQVGGGKKKAALAALAILVLWCAGLVVADGVARRRDARLPAGWVGDPRAGA